MNKVNLYLSRFSCALLLMIFALVLESNLQAQSLEAQLLSKNQLRLKWKGEVGTVYRILSKTNLTEDLWQVVAPPITSGVASAEQIILPNAKKEFFGIVRNPELGGALILQDGQKLTGSVRLAALSVPAPGNTVVRVVLLDVTDGVTNELDSVAGEGIADANFLLDTTTLKNGTHRLAVQVTDDHGYPLVETADYFSEPISVEIDNPIWLSGQHMLFTGWKLHIEFGTSMTDATYLVEVFDDTGAIYGESSGDVTEVNSEGYIVIDDAYTRGDNPRLRWVYDNYSSAFFDVVITIEEKLSAASGPSLAEITKPQRRVRKHYRTGVESGLAPRIAFVAEDPNAFAIAEMTSGRQDLDLMINSAWLGLSIIAPQFMLNGSVDQGPVDQNWNRLWDWKQWRNMNLAIADRRGYYLGKGPRITHMFTFSHGWSDGIGYRGQEKENEPGVSKQMTAQTLSGLGFEKENGLVFCFFDACSVASGGLIDFVLQNGGLKGRANLDQLLTQGKYPCYGCGWTTAKEILFAKILQQGHVDYIAQWWRFATDPDPQDPNLFANDYATTRARARFNPGSTKDVNPFSDNWDFRGFEEAYLDY